MLLRSIVLIALLLGCFATAPAQNEPAEKAEKLFVEADTLRETRKPGEMRQAISKYLESIPLFRQLGMHKREADAYNNIGYIYKNLREFPEALKYLQTAVRVSRESKNDGVLAIALLNLSQTYRLSGKIEPAAEHIDEAHRIAARIGDREKEAAVLNELGVASYQTGETLKAIEYFNRAAELFELVGKKRAQASLLNNAALISRMFGYQEKAINSYQTALAIFRAENDKAGEADVCLNLSAAYQDLFRTDEAIEHFNKALQIFREQGNKPREATVLNNIGAFYNDLGDYSNARSYYLQSAEIAEKAAARQQYASALKNLGILHTNSGEPEKGIELLTTALEISRELRDKKSEAWILNNLGFAYGRSNDKVKAEKLIRQSVKLMREISDRSGEAHSLYNLGVILYELGNPGEALGLFETALEIRKQLLTPGEEAKILLGIARIERDRGDSDSALKTIESAAGQIERLRDLLPLKSLRTTYSSNGKDVYDFYIDLLLNMNNGKPDSEHIAKAFEISERTRARGFIEKLLEADIDIRNGVDSGLIAREQSLQNRLNAYRHQLMNLVRSNAPAGRTAPLDRDIRAMLAEFEQVQTEIRAKSPEYAALVHPQPLSLVDIQRGLLDDDTILLEYTLGSDNSYLWVVGLDSISHFTLPKAAVIEAASRRFYESLNARSQEIRGESGEQRIQRIDAADRRLAHESRELSKMLLPFDGKSVAEKRVLVVAEGVLQYIPFAALGFGDGKSGSTRRSRLLVETNEVINLPSATSLVHLRKSRSVRKVEPSPLIAVFADPVFSTDDVRVSNRAVAEKADSSASILNAVSTTGAKPARSEFSRLKFSRREAAAISQMVPQRNMFLAMDFEASKQSAESERFRKARVVHFATHGIVQSEHPELSGIVLSMVSQNGEERDGILRLHDVYNLRLNAELVVLSACDTALGKEIKGEGIVGLARAFIHSGASDVVASLWRIDDRATSLLMKQFYVSLLKDGKTAAAALRQAQLAMLKEKATRHPYYWAAFTIQGDWR